MRLLLPLLAAILATGCALPHKLDETRVPAVFLAHDADAKTVTARMPDGSITTATGPGNVIDTASNFRRGDRVMLTCQDNVDGAHVAFTHIEKRRN